MQDLREAHLLDFWRQPAGTVPRSVQGVVVIGAAVTLAIALIGARMVWGYFVIEARTDAFWFENGLAILIAGALAVVALPRGGLSRYLRLAVALPVAHVIALLIAWRHWTTLRISHAPVSWESTSVTTLRELPIGGAAIAVAAVLGGAAWLIAHRRRGEWGHALVMLALAALLLLGLWLPIAAELWCRFSQDWLGGPLPLALALRALVLIPPGLAALAFTAIAVRRPAQLPRIRGQVAIGMVALFVLALCARLTHYEDRYIVFSRFVHVLLALGFAAAVALVVLGARIWLRGRRARASLARGATLTGVVAADGDDDDDAIACVEITSWLRGPRTMLRSFAVITPAGTIQVPGGVWVSPLAAATTQLRLGESVSVLRPGDRVVVAGMTGASGDDAHPFRTASAWLAGTGGISVAAPGAADTGSEFASVALALWRPCVAYLAILIAVGLPALLTAIVAS